MITNINTHYLDYYNEWALALGRVTLLLDMKVADAAADRFISILEEWMDGGKISRERAYAYMDEVQATTNKKYNTFFN